MPLYEYQCQQCGRRSEALQKMSDPPLATCEVCGGSLKRLISSPAVQFKGSGWYVTDYARKSGGASAGASKGSESGESKGDAAKSDVPSGAAAKAGEGKSGESSSGSAGGSTTSGGSGSTGGDS